MKGNFQVYMSVPLKHIKTSLLIKCVIKRDITTTVTTYIHATTYTHASADDTVEVFASSRQVISH